MEFELIKKNYTFNTLYYDTFEMSISSYNNYFQFCELFNYHGESITNFNYEKVEQFLFKPNKLTTILSMFNEEFNKKIDDKQFDDITSCNKTNLIEMTEKESKYYDKIQKEFCNTNKKKYECDNIYGIWYYWTVGVIDLRHDSFFFVFPKNVKPNKFINFINNLQKKFNYKLPLRVSLYSSPLIRDFIKICYTSELYKYPLDDADKIMSVNYNKKYVDIYKKYRILYEQVRSRILDSVNEKISCEMCYKKYDLISNKKTKHGKGCSSRIFPNGIKGYFGSVFNNKEFVFIDKSLRSMWIDGKLNICDKCIVKLIKEKKIKVMVDNTKFSKFYFDLK